MRLRYVWMGVLLGISLGACRGQVAFGLRIGGTVPYLSGGYNAALLTTSLSEYIAQRQRPTIEEGISIGAEGGITATTYFGPIWLQPELLYGYLPTVRKTVSNLPASVVTTNRVLGATLTRHFHFLTLPIIVGYDLPYDLNIHVGPQVQWLFAQTGSLDEEGVSKTLTEADFTASGDNNGDGVVDVTTSIYRKFHIGMVVGIGWISSIGIEVDLRYHLNFNEFYDPSLGDFQRVGSNHSLHWFSISAHYPLYQLGGKRPGFLPNIGK